MVTSMILRSPDFQDMEYISAHNGCDSDGYNPSLEILNVPENTKSLVIIMDDLDSPDEGSTNHWVLFNISPEIQKIEEDSIPDGSVEATNDFGRIGYSPPCPNIGTHRYMFSLYAIDKMLELDETAIKDEVEEEIIDSILDEASIVGLYERGEIVEDNYDW